MINDVGAWLKRQEVTVLSRLGAGVTPREAVHVERWVRELPGYDDAEVRSFVALVVNAIETSLAAMIEATPTESTGGREVTPARMAVAAGRDVYAFYRESVAQARVLTPGPRGSHMVYLLLDELGCLLYVGITSRGPQRLAEHYRSKSWFLDVCSTRFEWYATRAEIEQREKLLIRTLHPRYNVQHNGARDTAA
jgi:hypothetical protein